MIFNWKSPLEIAKYLEAEKIPLIGKIGFDTDFVEAMIVGKSIIEYCSECKNSRELKHIYHQLFSV